MKLRLGLLLYFCCLLLSGIAYAGPLPFIDNFDDGNATDGMPGTWVPGFRERGIRDASSGDFVVLSTGISSTNVEELSGIPNLSIRTQLNFSRTSHNVNFALLRARSGGGAEYFGGIGTDGLIFINHFDSGVNTNLDMLETDLDPVGGDVLLQFDVVGSQISLTAWQDGSTKPAVPQLMATDSNITVGGNVGLQLSTGVFSGGPLVSVTFRYFEAVPEPSAFALVTVCMLGICCCRRRRA